MIDLVEKLDQLAEYQAMLESLRLQMEDKRREILAQVQEQLDDLEAEYRPAVNAGQANVSELSDEIKQLVLSYGQSVKGAHLHAVYNKPREGWDTDGLKAYAKLHPEMSVFRKKADEPSVTIRASK